MKLNMDLIREILLSLEQNDGVDFLVNDLVIDGIQQENIKFHVNLMEEAGLIKRTSSSPLSASNRICATLKGYEFLNSVRDPKIWAKVKGGAQEARQWSV